MIIPIALICDDNYVVPTSVAISSMIASKKTDTVYDIYIICVSLSDENEDIFMAFSSDTVLIHILREDISRFSRMNFAYDSKACVASHAALLKFTLPEIIKEYEKVLYLDGDILVKEDLSGLFNTELGDNLLAAVPDSSSIYKKIYQFVPDYFNSGVMLLNLSQMRNENTSDTLIQAKSKDGNPLFMDQNVFNIVCDGRVLTMPIKYNLLAGILDRTRDKWTADDINKRYGTSYKSQEEVLASGAIIHFASKDKPWKNPFVMYADEWYNTYKNTPLKNKNIPDYKEMLKDISVTVSLTSYPERIKYVSEVIDSIKEQRTKPDRIVVYLAKEQFPGMEKDLPEDLYNRIKNEEYNTEIHWCEEDLKPHKKYFYAMQEYPDDIIITFDDDEHVPYTAVEELLVSYMHFPNAVSARRVHLITFDSSGRMLPYEEWGLEFNESILTPSMQLMGTGCSGILYPPHSIPKEAFDKKEIMENALNGDDLWLKAFEVMNDIPVVCANYETKLFPIEGSQEQALFYENRYGRKNDLQLNNICRYIDKCYGGTDILAGRIYNSDIGVDLTGTEVLAKLAAKKHNQFIEQGHKLKQAYADKSEINRKLQKTYAEKSELSRKLKKTYEEKSELTCKLNKTYEEKSELVRKLNKTYEEKSELNRKLQKTYDEKAERGLEIKRLQTEIDNINNSRTYKIGKIITWVPRQIKKIFAGSK